ncbi:MAG TPA: glycosyl hydrolase 108 family protein [Sunxiuqinia sp.]|nr:glycosyl hydrolase 108 family protein [Sunxiuqinia sp.]
MANFELAIEKVLQHEGGYVNDPVDPGGETNYGISKRNYPNVDIKNLTVDQAKEIYRTNYWTKVWGDQINDDELAMNIFDFAVNAGTGTSARIIQKIVGVGVDGVIGNITVSAINQADSKLAVKEFQKRRILHYVELVKKNNTLLRFLGGWINRSFM